MGADATRCRDGCLMAERNIAVQCQKGKPINFQGKMCLKFKLLLPLEKKCMVHIG